MSTHAQPDTNHCAPHVSVSQTWAVSEWVYWTSWVLLTYTKIFGRCIWDFWVIFWFFSLTNINLLTIHKNAKREATSIAYAYTYIPDEIWYECMRTRKKWFIINRYCHFGLEKAHDGSVNIYLFLQKCAGAHVCRYDANITHIHKYISMSKCMYTHIRMYLHIICDLLKIFKYIYLFSHVWHEGR